MPAHSLTSATVSFGLVSVPVRLYSAAESSAAISFNWLHKKCGSKLKQQYTCSKDSEIVETDDRVKGYEFTKGQYVTFTKEEIKALDAKASDAIVIDEFVPASTVDRMYLEKVYFLGPDKGGDRAYKLLSRALKDTGLVAIGQYSARGKEYIVMVRPLEGGLVMEQLHYAKELRSIGDVPLGEAEVKDTELKLAMQLIQQAATDAFHPEKYEDTVRQKQLDAIQQKVDGREITEEPSEAPKTQILDLMEALKASLARGPKSDEAERKPARREPAPKRKAAGGGR